MATSHDLKDSPRPCCWTSDSPDLGSAKATEPKDIINFIYNSAFGVSSLGFGSLNFLSNFFWTLASVTRYARGNLESKSFSSLKRILVRARAQRNARTMPIGAR